MLAPTAPPAPAPALSFDSALSDYAVLQQKPSTAQVFGATNSTEVTVEVSGKGCPSQTVKAAISNGTFVAKIPGSTGGDCYILATDAAGNTANLSHVTYGDVWYCGGQSNMALPVAHTFSRNLSAAAVMGGKYHNIRLKQISGNMNPGHDWISLYNAVTTRLEQGRINDTYLNLFSATCYYFAQSLTDELGTDAPPIGLVHTAYGGSMIEQVFPNP
jgi:sialate O-acetylesterase